MKKTVIWSLLAVALLTIIFFSLREEEVKIEPEPKSEPKLKPTKVWKVEELKVDTPKSHKDKNSSIANKKPTVWIDGFSIMTVGDVMTLHSKAKDEDGNISSYLWQEEGKILGRKPELPLMLSTEGEHTITLRVTDNLGAIAKSSIDIDVFAPYDKKVFYKHRHCHCKSLTYSYFNDEGNLTKEITDDKEGTTIKEFTYGDNGKLLSMHYKNYYDESNLEKESTTLYDKFGHEIEEFVEEKEYGELDDNKLVSFHSRHKYNEKGQMIESSMENNGVLNQIEKYVYDKDGNEQSFVYEDYKEGILNSRSIRLYSYDENGNLLSETSQEYDAEREITTVSDKEEYHYNDVQKILEKRVDDSEENRIKKASYDKEVLSNSNIYNSDGKIVESNRGGYNMRYIYDEETGVLKHLLIKEPSGQMSIKDYDESGELIKEVDENGKIFYEVDDRR